MTIAAILKGREAVVTLTADVTVAQAAALFTQHRIGAAPVMADGGVAGVFSERDVIRCLAERGAAALELTVGTVMTTPVVSVSPGDAVIGALSLMTKRRFRHLPVIDDGRLVGFVSIGDLVKYRIERIEADAAAMRDYIQSA